MIEATNLGQVSAEEVKVEVNTEKKSKIEKLSFFVLLLSVFLLPLFFIPSTVVPFQLSKLMLVSIGILVAFALWTLDKLKSGKFTFVSSYLYGAVALVFVSLLLSTVFSASLKSSFLGQEYELGSFVALTLMLIGLFITPLLVNTRERIFTVYLSFFFAFYIIGLFHLLRLLIGPQFLSFTLFTDQVSNIIGKWNDLGIFFGLITVASLTTLELINPSKLLKVVIYIALLLSLFFLALVNFASIWIVVALFALVFVVYMFSFRRAQNQQGEEVAGFFDSRKLPITSLIVLVVSVVFIIAGKSINTGLASKFNIAQIDLRPSWTSTLNIARSTLKADPILGVGPNRFINQWNMFKPAGVNNSLFWNIDFAFAVGIIPTFLITTGLLGFASWLIFLGIYGYIGFRTILSPAQDKFLRYLTVSSFLGSLYLWIFNFIYIPGPVPFALSFIFTGLFVSSAILEKRMKVRLIHYSADPRLSFASVMLLIVLLIASLGLGYKLIERFAASIYFQKSILTLQRQGDLSKAEGYVEKAIGLYENDTYYRLLAEMNLLKMNAVLQQQNVAQEELQRQWQEVFTKAVTSAQAAQRINDTGYQNWAMLGRVYESIVPLNIANAYENSRAAYDRAAKENPNNPEINLVIGRLELTRGNLAVAKEHVVKALQQKNNYTDAIFMLAQIQIREGNLAAAINSVEAASILTPQDPGVFFQLGLLRYNAKDYNGAITAFERALTLNNVYANAKYFLGLSYDKVGRDQDAIKQFEEIKLTNPDNKEIDLILANLKAGKDPFANASAAKPPIDPKPEKRKAPPLRER